MPPPELCDDACRKIILNGGRMAPIADQLATLFGKKHAIHCAAKTLAAAARSTYENYRISVETGVLDPFIVEGNWDGCEQATELMSWVIAGANQLAIADACGKMEGWTCELNQLTLSLASGRFATQKQLPELEP